MQFRNDRARKDGNLFEIKFDMYSKEKGMDPNKGFYVAIKPKEGAWITTIYTRRFERVANAQSFCEDIASGKVTLDALRQEQAVAEAKFMADKDLKNRNKASELLDNLANLGVSYSKACKIFKALSEVTGDFDVLDHCEKLSNDRPDPEKLIQENIVNITLTAYEQLIIPGVDLDAHQGHSGLTDFIISTAKKYEQEIGRHMDFDAPNSPSYWESIDEYAEKAIRKEYSLNSSLDHMLEQATAPTGRPDTTARTKAEGKEMLK